MAEIIIIILLIGFSVFREILFFKEIERKDGMFRELELKFAARNTEDYVRMKGTDVPVEEMDDKPVNAERYDETYDLDQITYAELKNDTVFKQ